MGERLLCKQEVIGSIPFSSTSSAESARKRCAGKRVCVLERAKQARACSPLEITTG